MQNDCPQLLREHSSFQLDMWQCVRTVGVVTTWGVGEAVLPALSGVEARDAPTHPAVHRKAPQQMEQGKIQHKMSTGTRLRSSVTQVKCEEGELWERIFTVFLFHSSFFGIFTKRMPYLYYSEIKRNTPHGDNIDQGPANEAQCSPLPVFVQLNG